MKKFFVPATLALVMLVSGCQQSPQGQESAPPEKPAQVAQDVKVKPLEPPPLKPVAPVEGEKQSPPSPTETLPAQSMRVKVYYPDDSGVHLVEVERKINVEHEGEKYLAAVKMLLDEPYEENLTTIFPKSASIRSVTVEGGLATVDLDGSIVKHMVGGSTGEEFLVGSIVDTLTNFPEVTKVKFLVDGKEIETLSGHMDLSTPLERMNGLLE